MSCRLISVVTHRPELSKAVVPRRQVAASSGKVIVAAGTWGILHLRALDVDGQDDEQWLRLVFGNLIPCGDCLKHWREMIRAHPPEWSRYFEWTVDRHNDVNARLGYPVISYEQARQIWVVDISANLNGLKALR